MIFNLFRKDPRRAVIAKLYERVADRLATPGLYRHSWHPGHLEGRFESVLPPHDPGAQGLAGPAAAAPDDVAKDLTDAFFRISTHPCAKWASATPSCPKRMKKLAAAFYGRAHAYDGPLDAVDEPALAIALGRNALGADAPAHPLARYTLAADRGLKEAGLAALLGEGHVFPEPDTFGA